MDYIDKLMTGSEIKKRILAKGFKLTDVARAMGISPQHFNAIAIRSKDVRVSTIERIAGIIGEPPSYFFNEHPILSIEEADRIKKLEADVSHLFLSAAKLDAENRFLKELIKEKDRTIKLLSKRK